MHVAHLSKAQPLPMPYWFKELEAKTLRGEIFAVPYNQMVQEAREYKRDLIRGGMQNIVPPSDDPIKFGLAIIDAQLTFAHPEGELFVPGSVEDSVRTAKFILMWVFYITRIAFTMDTHTLFQIFHPKFWVDAKGNHPAPLTQISTADIRKGTWTVNPAMGQLLGVSPADVVRWVLYYTSTLEANGQYVLMIWPYHAMLGGINHALVPIIEAAAFWWACLRETEYRLDTKGTYKLSDMFGAAFPEVSKDPEGTTMVEAQLALIKYLLEMDYLGFAGQALTHCVWTTAKQLHGMFSDPQVGGTHLLDRMRFFVDLSSPVQGFENQVPVIRQQLLGMNFRMVKSTDPISSILS